MKQACRTLRMGALYLVSGLSFARFSPAQDNDSELMVKLPELVAYKYQQDNYLVLSSRVDAPHAEFIKNLRKVSAIRPNSVPTSLIIDKYLHRKSQGIETEFCYLESDWIPNRDLAILAAIARKAAHISGELFGTSPAKPVKEVFVESKANYHVLVDAWAKEDVTKKQARLFNGAFVGEYRCVYRTELLDTLSLVVADSLTENVSGSYKHQDALLQGLHSYLTIHLVLRYQSYFALDSTTPVARGVPGASLLFDTAKEYLSRPQRDRVEKILKCELNDLNPERLAVTFALANFLLEKRTDRWKPFIAILEAESFENGKLKGPEGRRAALAKAVQDGLGVSFEELDKQLSDFTAKEYLYAEEVAALVGLDKETPDSIFQGFVSVCELKRAHKPVSEKGEKLHDEMMKKVDKILQERGEKW